MKAQSATTIKLQKSIIDLSWCRLSIIDLQCTGGVWQRGEALRADIRGVARMGSWGYGVGVRGLEVVGEGLF